MLNDEPRVNRDLDVPELLEHYKTQRAKLLAHSRELERLREQVRTTADREAAAVVTNARRDVRKVLLDARRELLVLVAQLQAVGCDTQNARANILPGEARETPALESGPVVGEPPDPFGATRQVVTEARRDVREVLLEARAELVALSGEATELRARLATQQPVSRLGRAIEMFPREATPPASTAAPAVVAPRVVNAAPRPALAAARPRIAAAPIHYSAPPPSRRLWIAGAGAAVFASILLVVFLTWGKGSEPVAARNGAAAPASRAAENSKPIAPSQPSLSQASTVASDRPSAAAAAPRAPVDRSVVSVVVTARRPVWMRTTLNGAEDGGRMYAAGETKRVMARQDVILRVGDAGAVLVSVDGGEPRPLGPNGVVMSRRFAPREPRSAPASVAVQQPPVQSTPVQQTSVQPLPPQAKPAPARLAEPTPVVAVPAEARADVGTAGTTEAAPQSPHPAAPPSTLKPRPLQENAPVAATPAEREIVAANQRWFEGYYSDDRAGMASVATPDFSLADQRTMRPRFPAGNAGVQRSMDQVRIDVAGESAVLSARLIERASVEGQPVQFISMVSEVWIRRDGRWRLMGVRLVDAADLGRLPQ